MQGFPILYHLPEDALLLKHMSIESVIPSSHFLCCPLLFLPSIFLRIRDFTNELALCIRCQSIGASASALVLLMNIQDWFPLGLTGLISQFKGLSRILSNTTAHKHQFLGVQLTLWSNSHIHTWLLGKPALTRWTFAGKGLYFLICYLVLS